MSDNHSFPSHDPERRQPDPYGAQPGANPYGGQQYEPVGSESGNPHQVGYSGSGQGQPTMNFLYNAQMVVRDRGLDTMQAIKYGFKATFARPVLWLVGTVIFFLALTGASFMSVFDPNYLTDSSGFGLGEFALVVQLVVTIACWLVMPLIIFLAIKQVDGYRLSLSQVMEGARWGRGLATSILVGLIVGIPTLLVFIALTGTSFVRLVDSDPAAYGDDFFALFFFIVGAALLVSVLAMFLGLFFQTATHYAVEDRAGIMDSIKSGAADVKRNYWPFLGLTLLWALINMAGAFMTFGLAYIVLLPASLNSVAFAYRQISRAPYPNI